ncbi:MAG: PKD domain-containing protein [Bacteroidota bacterium]|nr:PKD domain-containing protein [Bacteroidota bacterium]
MKRHNFRCLIFVLITYCNFLNKISAQCVSSFTTTPFTSNICDNQSVQFTLTSNSIITQRTWIFGDGTANSGSSNPSHVFRTNKDTVYKVSLIVRCSNGARDTSIKNINVFYRPQVDFSISKLSLCAINDSSCFTNLSTSVPGVTYTWDFGDLESSNKFSPCHTYYTGGDFDVELRAVRPANQGGCQQKVVKSISVKETPNPDFDLNPANGCTPFKTTITNLTGNTSNIVSWDWDFGDGTSFSGINPPAKDYNNSGTYNIRLTTSNNTGCQNFTSLPVLVSLAPTLTLTSPPNVCPNTIVTITAITNATAPIYTWGVDGGQIVSGNNSSRIQVRWSTGGIKNITLSLDQNGCVLSRSTFGFVFPETNLRAVYPNGNSVCPGNSVFADVLPPGFNNYTFFKGNTIIQNSSASFINLVNLVKDTSLSVRIIDVNNCSFTGTVAATVKPKPNVTITSAPIANICPGTAITFTASPSGLNDYLFLRNFSYVQSGTGLNYTKSDFIDHEAMLVVGTKNGCKDTSSVIRINIIDSTVTLAPVVNCGSSDTTQIEFTWGSVTGVARYEVSVNYGAYTVPSSGALGLKHILSSVSKGDSAVLRVRAIRNSPCADTSVSTATLCKAHLCNDISFSLKYDTSFCLNELVTIAAKNLTGITSNYQIYWGNQVSKDSTFTINSSTLNTIAGKAILVTLVDTSLKCASYKQIANGINVISVPSVSLNLGIITVPCSNLINYTAKSNPPNLTKYIYQYDNKLLPTDTLPVYKFQTNDTQLHSLSVTGYIGRCVGNQYITTFKGENLPTYKAVLLSNPKNQKAKVSDPTKPDKIICTKPKDPDAPKDDKTPESKIEIEFESKVLVTAFGTTITTTVNPNFSDMFKYKNDTAFYSGSNNFTVFTGPGENSKFNSQVSYNGCRLNTDTVIYLVEQSPPIPKIKPEEDLDKPNGTTTGNGLIESTCSYNKYAYLIYTSISGITWSIQQYTKVPIISITGANSYNIQVPTGTKESNIEGYSITFLNNANGCTTTSDFIVNQEINNKGTIIGILKSCKPYEQISIQGIILPLTQENDTLEFIISETLIENEYSREFQGRYIQTISGSLIRIKDATNSTIENIYVKSSLIPDFYFNAKIPANYSIKVFNKYGCSQSYDIKAELKTNIKINYTDSIRICKSDEIEILPFSNKEGVDSIYNFISHPFVFNDNSINKYLFKPDTIIDKFRVKILSCVVNNSNSGCCFENDLTGCVPECTDFQFIPNAFSPNGDKINDTWCIRGLGNPRVEVFSRWGELVYQSDQYKNDWEGNAPNGKPFPDGVYTYIVYPQGSFSMNTQTTHHILGTSADDYINQNLDQELKPKALNIPNPYNPLSTISRQLLNFDLMADIKTMDPKTKASYYFCKNVSFNTLKGSLIIQR